jgi:hypothetical protein
MMKKVVVVNANDGATVTFVIRPRKVGNVDLKVTARSRVAEDSVLRQLLVKVMCDGGASSRRTLQQFLLIH